MNYNQIVLTRVFWLKTYLYDQTSIKNLIQNKLNFDNAHIKCLNFVLFKQLNWIFLLAILVLISNNNNYK